MLENCKRLICSPSLNKVYCIVLYCIVLYCIVLYCIVLYCIVLYCIVLYCIVLYCIVLYCIVLYCIVLYCKYLDFKPQKSIPYFVLGNAKGKGLSVTYFDEVYKGY